MPRAPAVSVSVSPGGPVRPLRRVLLALTIVGTLVFAAVVWSVVREPVRHLDEALVVNDVTRLNPIEVSRVIAPTTTEEIVDAVKQHPGPISIGGARHSMGGQIASSGALHIDMRGFDQDSGLFALREDHHGAGRVALASDPGTHRSGRSVGRHHAVLRRLHRRGLALGDVHGRYIGNGPLILSAQSVKRRARRRLRGGGEPEAQPGDLLRRDRWIRRPRRDHRGEVRAGRQRQGEASAPDIAAEHLSSVLRCARAGLAGGVSQCRLVSRCLRHGPCGHVCAHGRSRDGPRPSDAAGAILPVESIRVLDRLRLAIRIGRPAARRRSARVSRTTGHVAQLRSELRHRRAEPASRARSTYMLQEYFVPPDRFDEFAARLRDVLRRRHVHAINVSIRHANADPGSLLAWAKTDVFGFVIYYKQGTGPEAQRAVQTWTRELIERGIDARRLVLPAIPAPRDRGAVLSRLPARPRIPGAEAPRRSGQQVPQCAVEQVRSTGREDRGAALASCGSPGRHALFDRRPAR